MLSKPATLLFSLRDGLFPAKLPTTRLCCASRTAKKIFFRHGKPYSRHFVGIPAFAELLPKIILKAVCAGRVNSSVKQNNFHFPFQIPSVYFRSDARRQAYKRADTNAEIRGGCAIRPR